MRRFVAEARRQCATPLTDVGAGMRIIAADTLAVDTLDVRDSLIANAWSAVVDAGVLTLPARVKRDSVPSDEFTYVVELRRGSEYRASQIEHMAQPATDADRRVQAIYAAVSQLLPPELVVKP